MKKTLLAMLILGGTGTFATAQSLGGLLNQIFNQGSQSSSNTNRQQNNSYSNLSSSDIASGLKQALEIGAQNASNSLSATDGFFKNAAVKILMPPEAQKVEATLRSFGLGSVADKAILAMNRAAEDAAKKAAPIFISAIKGITIQDGINILRGGNNAATTFLRSKTATALTNAFAPVIKTSLNKVNAQQIWNTVFSTYNSLPLSQNKVNTDLTAYVTQKALDGIFTEIAQEEMKIRTDPAAQVTGLLQKVFGNK